MSRVGGKWASHQKASRVFAAHVVEKSSSPGGGGTEKGDPECIPPQASLTHQLGSVLNWRARRV